MKSKKKNEQLRKEIRILFADELNRYTNLDKKDYQMKFNLSNDLGVNELDLMIILDRVEDRLGVELSEDDSYISVDNTVFDVISYYNENLLRSVNQKNK